MPLQGVDKPSISSLPPQWVVKGPRNIGLGWCLRNASRKSWWVGWHCYLLVLLRLVRYSYEFSQTSRRMWRKNRSPCPTPFFSFLGLWKGNLLPWHVILTFFFITDLLSTLIPSGTDLNRNFPCSWGEGVGTGTWLQGSSLPFWETYIGEEDYQSKS